MPSKRAKPKTYERALALRKELTPAERKLWSILQGLKFNGVSFKLQHVIENYIVDIVSIKHRLIMELDGRHHLEQTEYYTERTLFLESQGYRGIRFWNDQIEKEMDGVVQLSETALENR